MTPLTTRSIEPALQHDRSCIDWGAILAGAVIATSISVVLTGFGSAIGLSMTSPFEGKGFSGAAIAVAIGLWVVWVAVSSLIAGSYLAGRMRRRAGDAIADEVSVRDGVHGLVVWALAALIGVVLASMSVAGFAKSGAEIARSGVATVAGLAANTSEYAIDTIIRSNSQAAPIDDATRQQIGRVLVRAAADGQLSEDDRTYLTRTVAGRAGIEPAEVERRIAVVFAQAKAALDRTRAAAESARRFSILIAFLTAASLAVAAAAAWWGASLGGKHRDENTDCSKLMHW
jgi:FtsH-binding integral membrane protein